MEPQLNKKEMVDIYLKRLEITQTGFEGRRKIEWTVAGLLWSGIIAGTGFIYDKNIEINTGTVICISIFYILYIIWSGYLCRAYDIDKKFRKYYFEQINFLMGEINTIPDPPPTRKEIDKLLRKPLFMERWVLLEILITGVLLTSSGFILS